MLSLPSELIDRILELLASSGHQQTLKLCALVCSALLPLARRQLFRKLDLSSCSSRHRAFSILQYAPDLLEFSRHVVLRDMPWFDSPEPPAVQQDALTRILWYATPIASVTLRSTVPEQQLGTPFFARGCGSLHAVFSRVRRLVLQSCGFRSKYDLFDVLGCFPNMEELVLYCPTQLPRETDKETNTRPFGKVELKKLVLEGNKLGGCPPRIIALARSVLSQNCLHSLSVDVRMPNGFEDLWLTLAKHSKSLKTLSLKLHPVKLGKGILEQIASLTEVTEVLEELILEVVDHPVLVDLYPFLEGLFNGLQTVSIHYAPLLDQSALDSRALLNLARVLRCNSFSGVLDVRLSGYTRDGAQYMEDLDDFFEDVRMTATCVHADGHFVNDQAGAERSFTLDLRNPLAGPPRKMWAFVRVFNSSYVQARFHVEP